MENNRTESTHELFTSKPVGQVFLALCLPVILGMVVSLLYNMVDTYFIGLLGDANQMAAVSLCTPLFTLLMGLGNIFGIGGSSVVSRLMGQQAHKQVRQASSLCFYFSGAVGLFVLILLLMLQEPILPLLGTSEATIAYTRQYYTCFIFGAPIMMFQYTLLNLLRCDGCAKQSMLGSVIGSIINIILDPIFIFSLKMGVAGAAIATVIGNGFSVAVFLFATVHRAKKLSVSPKYYHFDVALLRDIFAIGLPASITNALTSVATVLMNQCLLPYGETAIAAQGIAMKINQIVILLQVGFAGGLPPVFGYNWGAKNRTRLRQLFRSSVLFSFSLGFILTAIVYFCAPLLIRFFMNDALIVDQGTQLLRGLMLCGPFLGILFIINNFFQATGRAIPALILSLCRQGIVFFAILSLFNSLWGWNGLIYVQAVSDYVTLLIALLLFINIVLPFLNDKR